MKRIEVPDVSKLIGARRQQSKGNVSPLHEFILKARTELGEKSTTGDGSFGFYLGILKKIPIMELYSMLASSKGAKDPLRNFWWRVGDYKKNQKKL